MDAGSRRSDLDPDMPRSTLVPSACIARFAAVLLTGLAAGQDDGQEAQKTAAHAARLLAEAGAERPLPRSFLTAWRDEQRRPIEDLLLPLIARCVPRVDAHDPDRTRVHAALLRVLARGRLEADAGLQAGEAAEFIRFARALGAPELVPMLHAFDNQLRLDYVAGERVYGQERLVTERNPEFDGWTANVSALREALRTADDKIRSAAGIAPSDPGWATWLGLQPGIPGSLAELLELRAQAAQSLAFRSSFPPTATTQRMALERVGVPELTQRYGGHAAREVVVLADDMSVDELVRYELPETAYVRRSRTAFAEAVDEWRDPKLVSDEVRAALDRRTDEALERLLARIVAARLGRYLAEGRREGWTDEQVHAEALALQFWFGLPSSDPSELAAAADPARDPAPVLEAQVGRGGWARRLHALMPRLPPFEDLVEVQRFECRVGANELWSGADLRHVVVREPDGEHRVFDLGTYAVITGGEAERIAAGGTSIFGLGDAVTWADASTNASSFDVRWTNEFWASIQRRIGEFEFRPVYFRDERGVEHQSNQLLEFEVVVDGPRDANHRPTQLPVVRVPVPQPIHDGGLLARGQLAWTLSQARQLQCSRSNCTHSRVGCWDWSGEPSIELWHLPSGDLLWRAESCRQLVILEHIGRVLSVHEDRSKDPIRRTIRVWGIPAAK